MEGAAVMKAGEAGEGAAVMAKQGENVSGRRGRSSPERKDKEEIQKWFLDEKNGIGKRTSARDSTEGARPAGKTPLLPEVKRCTRSTTVRTIFASETRPIYARYAINLSK